MLLSAIIWNASPTIFKTGVIDFFGLEVGPIEIRWYGLLFAMGFLVGQYVLVRVFRAEGKPESHVEELTLYMMFATVVGARLGHCLFYDFDYYISHPLEILMIWQGGLASHGAALGILAALWLYARKHPDQSYLWILDRIVIVVALAGAFIRFGNFMNSEIVGKPTEAFTQTIFAREGGQALAQAVNSTLKQEAVESIEARLIEGQDTLINGLSHPLIAYQLELAFPVEATVVRQVANRYISTYFAEESRLQQHIYVDPLMAQAYQTANGTLSRFTLKAWGKPRHPSQLYESISCFLLFFLLLAIYARYTSQLPSGLIFGVFMIWIWGLRFVYEFFKENQVAFEDSLTLNMGQLLSIPLTLVGVFVLLNALRSRSQKGTM